MSPFPCVSVLVPMLNEAADISGCIEHIAAQTWPSEQIELVLIDASSTDDSVQVAKQAALDAGLANVVVCRNDARRTSIGLNVGLAAASGEYVARVDARSRIGQSHLERCVATLRTRADVGVVGGGQRARARADTTAARSIARALNNRWLTGFARYRRGGADGPADTVWMGAFRAEDLRTLGGWDDATALNEDYELNERYRAAGRVVWFDSALDAGYLPRARVRLIAKQYLSFGRVKADGWVHGRRPAPRQLALLAMPPALVAGGAVATATFGIVPVVVGATAAAAAVDITGARASASIADRVGALCVNGVMASCWWWGVASGMVRSSRGDRPQATLAAQPTR
jgi:glycosyltransferase involved in cell wall biosynthesis